MATKKASRSKSQGKRAAKSKAAPDRGSLSETVTVTREDLLSMSRQIDDAVGFVIDAKTPSLIRAQLGIPPTDWALMTLRSLQHSIIKHAASAAIGGAP